MRHSEISKSPCKHGYDINERVGSFCATYRIVSCHHGEISRKGFCMINNCGRTACYRNTEAKYNDQCDGHDNALDKVCCGCCKETTQSGISDNDKCTDDHCCQIAYSKKTGEKLSACSKSGSCIWNKENNNKNSSDRLQDFSVIAETVAEKGWQCDRIAGHMCVETNSFCYDLPVEIGSDRQADSCPSGICDSGKIG